MTRPALPTREVNDVTDVTGTAQQRPCPVCGGVDAVPLRRVCLPQVDGSSLPARYQLVVCRACDLGFADSSAVQADYDEHYRSLATYAAATGTSGGQNPADRQRMRELASRVVALHEDLDRPLRVLDLGSGAGGLIDALRGLGHTGVGLDPDPAAVQVAGSRGLEVREGLVTDAHEVFAGERFEVVVLSHVLEHMRDLGWLSAAAALLALGGCLYVEVPDARRYAVGVRPPGYFYDSEHINHFGPRALEALGRRVGLHVTGWSGLDLPLPDGSTYPALGAVLRTTGGPLAPPPAAPVATLLRAYLEESVRVGASLAVEPQLPAGGPVLVWGVGSFTQRLLGDGVIRPQDVVALVDGAPSKQGRTLLGRPVVAPDQVRSSYPGVPVVVAIAVGAAAAGAAVARWTDAPVHHVTW